MLRIAVQSAFHRCILPQNVPVLYVVCVGSEATLRNRVYLQLLVETVESLGMFRPIAVRMSLVSIVRGKVTWQLTAVLQHNFKAEEAGGTTRVTQQANVAVGATT